MTPPLNSVPDYCALHICGLSTIQHLNTSPLDSVNFLPILEKVKIFFISKGPKQSVFLARSYSFHYSHL